MKMKPSKIAKLEKQLRYERMLNKVIRKKVKGDLEKIIRNLERADELVRRGRR